MDRRAFLRSSFLTGVSVTGGFALPGCWRPPPESFAHPAAVRLLDLIAVRLGLMHEVAKAKWNRKSPAEDPVREKQLLAAVAEAGRSHGLEPSDTKAFFADQIEAAKQIQRACFREWEFERRGPFPDAMDLVRDLRPRIDQVGRELLVALAAFRRSQPISGEELDRLARAHVTGPGVTAEVRETAIRHLRSGK